MAKTEDVPGYITADFVMSSPDLKHCPRDDLPEVAFAVAPMLENPPS